MLAPPHPKGHILHPRTAPLENVPHIPDFHGGVNKDRKEVAGEKIKRDKIYFSSRCPRCVARKAASPGLLLAESPTLPTLRELTKHKTENS